MKVVGVMDKKWHQLSPEQRRAKLRAVNGCELGTLRELTEMDATEDIRSPEDLNEFLFRIRYCVLGHHCSYPFIEDDPELARRLIESFLSEVGLKYPFALATAGNIPAIDEKIIAKILLKTADMLFKTRSLERGAGGNCGHPR